MWLLDVPFDDRQTATWAGARWDPQLRRFTFTGDVLPAELTRFAAVPHSWEAWLQDDVAGGWVPAPRPSQVTLHPHQADGAAAVTAARAAGLPGFLLADDVGLGKTYTTVAAVDASGAGLNVLVLAPLSVVTHWRRSIDRGGTGRNRWCVINYDRAKQLLDAPASAQTAKRTRTRNKRTAAAGRSKVAWDVVVCDEAHLLRNPVSQRSAAVRQLIGTGPDGRRRVGAFTVWLSATAGQHPLELSYLAPLLAATTGSAVGDLAEFEHWCRSQHIAVTRGRFGAWGWDRNDADLETMRRLLFTGDPAPGLRRRPTDLAGWPEQQRIGHPVDLDPAARAAYETAWGEFRAVHTAARTGDPATDAAGAGRGSVRRRSGRGSGTEHALTALLRFRQKASLLRVDATADLVVDLVGNDRAVAVSAEFHDTVDALVAALAARGVAAVVVSGRESATERETNRVAFQTGQVPVVVFTVVEGISLHAGEQAVAGSGTERALVVHDPRWSAIQTAQIEGRTHRDGRNAVAYHCFAADTVEEQVVAVTLQRLTDMKTMIGDDVAGLDLLDRLSAPSN